RVVGGLAAPLFLLTAGAALGLGALRGRTVARAAERGFGLVALGFLLQLERWAVDRGALADAGAWPALLFGLLAGAAFLVATTPPLRRRPVVARVPTPAWIALAVALLLAHVACVAAFDARCLATTLRFDVLHCIGISTVICALAVPARPRREALSVAILAAAAIAIALVTPAVARALGDAPALAWIARARELRSIAPFPVLPWCGYAVAGCALARAVAWAASSRRAARVLSAPALAAIAVLASIVAAVAFEGGLAWTRHALSVLPDARILSRLVFHLGVATALACACGLLARSRRLGVVRDLGRASLAIYVLHVPLAYGAMAEPFDRSLSPSACAVAAIALVAACAVGATMAARARSRRAGGEDAHMLAGSPSFEGNLRA
ncbi:MAG TPA: heparan-alpha-glucosaminide N-acetyltransferase domain-containing protein, partial [Sandaracinaceae bacterium]